MEKPGVVAVRRADTRLHRKIVARLNAGAPSLFHRLPLVGMKGIEPSVVFERLRERHAGMFEPTAIEVIHLPVGAGRADYLRNCVGEHAQHALVAHGDVAGSFDFAGGDRSRPVGTFAIDIEGNARGQQIQERAIVLVRGMSTATDR